MTDLHSLKPGDEVAVVGRYNRVRIAKIQRVTRTQIIADRHRYRRDTGTEIPFSGIYTHRLELVGDHHREWVEREAMERVLSAAFSGHRMRETIEKLSTEQLSTIAGALKEVAS